MPPLSHSWVWKWTLWLDNFCLLCNSFLILCLSRLPHFLFPLQSVFPSHCFKGSLFPTSSSPLPVLKLLQPDPDLTGSHSAPFAPFGPLSQGLCSTTFAVGQSPEIRVVAMFQQPQGLPTCHNFAWDAPVPLPSPNQLACSNSLLCENFSEPSF